MMVTLTYLTEVEVEVDTEAHSIESVRVKADIDASEPCAGEDERFRPVPEAERELAAAVVGDPSLRWPQWRVG